ncbi:MAG: quaternary amine ABC transporter ATP-binding protein [Allorhizobium sp.]
MADTRVSIPVDTTREQRPIKLACRNVWKVFGNDARQFIETRDGRADAKDLSEAGLIGAVRSVDLEIRQGEIFIIMGLSGSGKSTLVRCMSRLIEPTFGKVEFEGKDLLKISDAELIELRRHRMGMVFQNFALLPHLNVLENIAFPLSIQGMGKVERENRAREVIDLVSLGGREHFYPRELSGGQQQRVGIARSLATKPEIWFLDEPFSALDPLIRREMQDELMRLQAMLNKTIVFITHDFDEAIRLADRVAIMKDGEVIQIGTPEELVINPATDYVAEFTRDVQRAKVVSARSLMQPLVSSDHGGSVSPGARISSFASQIVSSGKPFAVVDDVGLMLGEVTPDAVIGLLAGIDGTEDGHGAACF